MPIAGSRDGSQMKPPNDCNSIHCNGNLDRDYCINGCSHAVWMDTLVVNGKEYHFEFNQVSGPTFLRKDGEPRVRQPSEKHPVWKEFDKWIKEDK